MGEVITDYGELAGACGHDGTDWIKLLVDEDGKLQITIDTSALPEGAATAANQTTMITALQLIDDLRGALDSVDTDELVVNVDESALPSGASTSANQSTAITALQSIQNLVGALHDVGLDELDVNVDSSVLPTGAATSANQSSILTELGQKLETADLNIDASKDLQVDVKTVPTTVVIPGSGEKFLGFAGLVGESLSNLNLDAGTNNLDGTAVPSGYVYVITQVCLRYDGTVPDRVLVAPLGTPAATVYFNQESPVSTVWYTATIEMILEADDYITGQVDGATAGDDLRFRYSGYKFAAP